MIAGSLARRYARAMLEVGIAKGNYEKLGQEVDELAASYHGSRELSEALTNPVFPRTKRRDVLVDVLKRMSVSPETKNFSLLLFDRERIPYLPAIARELRLMTDEKAGRIRATVTSAKPLSADESSKIQGALEKASALKVVMEKKEDPALIGGVVAQIGDLVYDGSVRTQLEQMREQIISD